MKRVPPSGYVPAAQHSVNFAKRMKLYQQRVEDEKRKQQENAEEVKAKVKPLKAKS